ncbi:hypothetical protein [Halosimplex halobium]|uniref:hypothetical protein n=1 Tax=Halosimplex halobium TaxID=3396618 RepID=UPI003F5783C4
MADMEKLDNELMDLRSMIESLEDDWRAMESDWDDLGNINDVEDELIPLVISTYAAIEDITSHVLVAYVVKDGISNTAFDYIYSDMSQSHREQFLIRCNLLSRQTRGKIGNFRALRNKIAHGSTERLDWYRDDVPHRMNLAFEVLDLFTAAFTDSEFIDELVRDEETAI